MIEVKKIEKLYELYGFKIAICKKEYMVFTYSTPEVIKNIIPKE